MKTIAKCLSTLSVGAVMGCSPIPVVIAPAPAPALALAPVAIIPLEILHPQPNQEAIDTESREIAVQMIAPRLYLVEIAPHVYELRDRTAPPKNQVAEAVPVHADKPMVAEAVKALEAGTSAGANANANANANACSSLQVVRVEISNGVGINLLARRTAMRLASSGVVTARLTNQPRFDQARTEIQFAAGQEGAASALSALLPATVKWVASGNLARNIQIRLVLGRDFAGDKTALWLNPQAVETNHRVAVVAPLMAPEAPASCKV